jgi:hypothetical protein
MTMTVVAVGPNLSDQSKGTFRVHKHDCADLKKDLRLTRERPWVLSVATKRELVEDVYPPGDFEWSDGPDDESYWGDIWFAPCVTIPRG